MYQAWGDQVSIAEVVRRVILGAADAVGSRVVRTPSGEIDLDGKWRWLSVYPGLSGAVGEEVTPETSVELLRKLAEAHEVSVEPGWSAEKLVIELFGDTGGQIDRSKGTVVYADGMRRELRPGELLKLAPGESVTLMPNEHWHAFWGEGGDVFVGEVSTVNDDNTDNLFEDPRISRFSGIEEDEEPWYLLVSDYKTWLA